jgi:hypothetical protein
MARVEYRSELLPGDAEGAVAQLNRWGEAGWQAFQMDAVDSGFRVWLSRELAIAAGGLQTAGTAARRSAAERERAAPVAVPANPN